MNEVTAAAESRANIKLAEAIAQRGHAERAIAQALLDFEAMTGLQVERVDIVRSSGPTSPPIFVRVRAEV